MDYDDSDFQSQNFQLVGEDNNKFPSSLRPFALPKFDIEEQLQVPLRFDNLIESEVYFGVQGHGNNWIEGLSTGSSVVEFSSSAAESCSISRTNNVWSEATSTESVEMLLKSVGENDTSRFKDSSAPDQLSGMDSHIDPLCTQDKSSNTSSRNIVVDPNKSNDQFNSTPSRLTEDASRSQPQVENILPSSVDEKSEKVLGSNLSHEKSNSMVKSDADKCILDEKVPSTSNNASKSCLAVGDYFDVVHDDAHLENLKGKTDSDNYICLASEDRLTCPDPVIHGSKEGEPLGNADSTKLNNQLFSEQMAELQNIYASDSYRLGPDNRQEARVVTTAVAEICRLEERKMEGDLPELKSLSCVEQSLDSTKLLAQGSNETLLSESSDGLLEAITCPVKKLHRDDDTCKAGVCTKEASLSHAKDTTNILTHSVEGSNEHVIKDFDMSEQMKYVGYHQPEFSSQNPSHHLDTPAVKNSKLIQSGNERQLAHVKEAPEETKNPGDNNTDTDPVDNSKVGVMEQYPDLADPLKSGVEKENKDDNERIVDSRNFTWKNIEQAGKSGSDEDAKDTTNDPSKATLGSSEGVVPEDSLPALLDEDLKSSSKYYNKSIKGGTISNLVDEPNDNHSVSPGVSASQAENTAASANLNSNAISLIAANSVTEKIECTSHDKLSTQQVTSSDSLAARDTQNKLGFDCSTKEGIPLVSNLVAHPDKCSSDSPPVMQPVHHGEVALSSSALAGSSKKDLQKAAATSVDVKDKLDVQLSDNVLDQGADELPVSARSKMDHSVDGPGSGDASCTEATCGSPTVISCSEHYLQEGRESSNILLDHGVPAKSVDPKDAAASADHVHSSKTYSSDNVKSNVQSFSRENATTEDDRSFSFEVGERPKSSENASSPDWKPFPSRISSQHTVASMENPQDGSPASIMKKTSEDISKEASVTGGVKEVVLEKQKPKIDRSVNSSITEIAKTNDAQLEEMQQCPAPESSSMQAPCPQVVQTSSLPDLNTSASTAALVRQPFTDSQHVQLRAQIFVYGALIQGIPPSETYMMSAFGEPGGGRTAWEAVWRAAVERIQNQKSPLSTLETPTSARLGSWAAEQGTKDTVAKNSPASRTSGKVMPSTRAAVQLHSPTVDMSSLSSSASNLPRGTHLDFSPVISPLFTYHSSQMRQPISNVAPWFPQSPRPAPWLVSPQSLVFDSSAQSPAVPTTETTKVTSSRNLAVSHSPSTQLVSPGTFLPSQGHPTSSALVIQGEKQKPSVSTPKTGASQKSRKRKKASGSVEQQHVQVSHLQTEPASVTPATKHPAIPSGFTLSNSPSKVLSSGCVPNTSQIVSTSNYQIMVSKDAEQRVNFSAEVCSAMEQSKVQAEDAAVHSTIAREHSQGIWSQLSANAKNGLPSEVEEKLTSAVAAAAAAAAVAKAAAEAAKMASEAALQAKMMADEALRSDKTENSPQKYETGKLDAPRDPVNPARLTPSSTFKGKDKIHGSYSIISVAREVARKRVEAASAAAKRAENLDAILKAAELAAEAVSQAGAIIAMGDPLPFTMSKLLEAGPEGYWKSHYARTANLVNTSNLQIAGAPQAADVADDIDRSGRKDDNQTKKHEEVQKFTEASFNDKQLLQLEGNRSGNEVEDVPTTAPLNSVRNSRAARSTIGNGIQKGSLVEAAASEGSSKGAWFSARVLDIKDNSVYISYIDHTEGSGHCEEWVPLQCEGDTAPRIRVAHSVTAGKFEGTRKRRRDVVRNYAWAVGDHVDAWIKDSWWEGVIAEKNEGDETKFVVHFPAGGDSVAVNAWNLRPSLVWKDGQWTEWSRVRERNSRSDKGDSPYEKRQRLGLLEADSVPGIVGGGAGPSANENIDNATKPEESRPLKLSDRDMIFNVGKSVVEENKANALRLKRSGLQKEGSKVVFGVPRPGKKRKFMEVSKHYVADKADKVTEGNASVKFAKYLMPQAPRPRESTSKVDMKGKKANEMKSRGLKSVKSQDIMVKNTVEKESLSTTVPSSDGGESDFGLLHNMRASFNSEVSSLEKKNALDVSLRNEDSSLAELSVQPAFGVSTSKKSSSTNGEQAKRKLAPAVDNLNRNEHKTLEDRGKTNTDVLEPRRSNRRIQPTSRLLEGLQSSLIISKVPGERGVRGLHRSASSSRGRTHG